MLRSFRPKFPRDANTNQQLVFSIVLWIAFSFILYSFADGAKEMFRLVTGLLGPQEFLHLTAEEQRFYKIFYAALSLVIAFGHFSKQFLQRPTLRRGDFRYSKSAILFEQTFLGNYTLHIFTKLAVMYGILIWAVPVFLHFDFFEYRFLLLLLPLVIFLSQWLSLNRIFKRHAMKWMGLSLLSIAALSLIFSRISIIHYSAVDKVILQNHPLTYYDLDLPKPGSEAFIRYSRNINGIYASIYIAKLKAGQAENQKYL